MTKMWRQPRHPRPDRASRDRSALRALQRVYLATGVLAAACGSDPAGTASPKTSPAVQVPATATPFGSGSHAPSTATATPAPSAGTSGAAGSGTTLTPPSTQPGPKPGSAEIPNTAAAAGSHATAPVPSGGELPCSIRQVLASNCQKCHSAQPLFGAPMPLVTRADLDSPAKSNPAETVAQLSAKRIADAAAPMPPGNNITETDKQTLIAYLTSGQAPASPNTGECKITQMRSDEYLRTGVVAGPDETCYEFKSHAGQTPDDSTKYSVVPGEHYEEFLFKVPWGPGKVATKFASKLDNIKVAHHWLFFSTNKTSGDGTHMTTVGTVLGSGASLLAGWAVGGDHVIFPNDMGLELPASGILNAQWHYYNQGNQAEADASAIQVCVTDASKRKYVAGITWLGTENFNGLFGMPAKTKSEFTGTCLNDSGAPITIWGFTPHMHKLGRHMKAVIKRKDGRMETVFDQPFDFNAQITYPVTPVITLEAGESIVSTCTFDNITDAPVPYGPSSNQEMCYNFTVSYPLGALNNQVTGLNGALNNCW